MCLLLISTVLLLGNVAYLNALPDKNERLFGGVNQIINNRPFQVAVFPQDGFCGGSIISSSWIITAAHCTYGYKASDILFAVGVQNINYLYREQLKTAIKLVQHRDYVPANKDNDIALFQSPEPIAFSATVKPIDLMSYVPDDGTIVTVSGYGDLFYDGVTRDALMRVDLKVIKLESCKEAYPARLTDNMLCADVLKDICEGRGGPRWSTLNSGGPLTYEGKLLGVVSFGHGCAESGFPGIYTKVPNFVKWIEENTGVPDLEYFQ